MRLGGLLVFIVTLVVTTVCGAPEPKPAEMLSTGAANLRSAKTVHMAATGSFALKGGMSLSFDFKIDGDASLPDSRSHLTLEMAMFGQTITAESITLGGKTYAKDPVSGTWSEASGETLGVPGIDPLANTDLSGVRDIVEIDRPTLDGRTTRHFSYTVPTDKIREAMTKSTASMGSALEFSGVDGRGEIWIRTDDSQIVRQLVKLGFTTSGAAFGLPGASAAGGSATLEVGMDVKFSKHGEPIPSITAPPTPAQRTVPPIRTLAPSPTR